MIAEALMIATTVWYIPGWMRTEALRPDLAASISNAFPKAEIVFKGWDGDRFVWPHAVESADKESWRFAFEAAMLPKAERENLVIVGHSLGGRIAARVLARLGENGLKVRQGLLLAAAIPNDDPDLTRMGEGSSLPVVSVRNPQDVTLSYAYRLAGGEGAVAFGAKGSPVRLANVDERTVPASITREVEIDAAWGKVQLFKDIANHHDLFYFEYLRRVLSEQKGAMP